MIPYLLWIFVIVIIIVASSESVCSGKFGTCLLLMFVVSAGFSVYLISNGWSEQERQVSRIEDARKKAIDEAPETRKRELIDGCAIYYYYGNGIKSEYTVKFVRCPNSVVDTEKKWSCGTTKNPKTCTENISTSENN